jgi:hypothetical protein
MAASGLSQISGAKFRLIQFIDVTELLPKV